MARRPAQGRRGQRHGALDLVAPRRQPERRARGRAGARRPPDTDDGARGRNGATAARHPQVDQRRAAHGGLRPGQGARHPESEDLFHDRTADRDHRGRRGDPAAGRPDARAAARTRSQGSPVRAAHALGLVVRTQALDAVSVGAVRWRRVAPGQARDHQARRAPLLERPRAAREPARGGPAGAPGARRPARRRLSRAGGRPRGRLAPRTARVGGRRRLLHDAPAVDRRADAMGSFRCGREEERPAARVGADRGRRAGRPGSAGMMVTDVYQRPLRNLRISVTDRCNLRCAYCMPGEDYVWLPREQILDFEEISTLVDVFMDLGVDKIRLTGGEPLLRRDLPALVRQLAAKPKLRDLALTTNGVLLAEQARPLRTAGLHRVTVSLDTLRPDRFAALTRRANHAQVLAGIAAVAPAGFTGTKLDTVVMRDVNDDELADLIEYGRTVPAEVRFIEYMDVGGATRWSMDKVVSRADMLGILERRYGRIEP